MNFEAFERFLRRVVNGFCLAMLVLIGIGVILLLAEGLYVAAIQAAVFGPLSVAVVYILNNWVRPRTRAWFDNWHAKQLAAMRAGQVIPARKKEQR